MLAIVKTIICASANQKNLRLLYFNYLEKLVEQTDNELDDKALAVVKKGLGL